MKRSEKIVTQNNQRTPKQITSGKYRRLMALSDEHGVIAALAIDQRGSLKKALAAITDRVITTPEIVNSRRWWLKSLPLMLARYYSILSMDWRQLDAALTELACSSPMKKRAMTQPLRDDSLHCLQNGL